MLFVLGLAEVGELKAQMFNLAQMFNRIPNAQFSTSAPILASPCWWQFYFFTGCCFGFSYVQNLSIRNAPRTTPIFPIITLSSI